MSIKTYVVFTKRSERCSHPESKKIIQGKDGKMNAALRTYQKGEIPGVIAIRASLCKGCDACKRHCPTGAITGSFGATHSIDADLCLSCGQCLINCPFEIGRASCRERV